MKLIRRALSLLFMLIAFASLKVSAADINSSRSNAGEVLQQLTLKTLQYTKDCDRMAKKRLSQSRLTLPGKLRQSEKELIIKGLNEDFFSSFVQQCVKTAMSRDNSVILLRNVAAQYEQETQRLNNTSDVVSWGQD